MALHVTTDDFGLRQDRGGGYARTGGNRTGRWILGGPRLDDPDPGGAKEEPPEGRQNRVRPFSFGGAPCVTLLVVAK